MDKSTFIFVFADGRVKKQHRVRPTMQPLAQAALVLRLDLTGKIYVHKQRKSEPRMLGDGEVEPLKALALISELLPEIRGWVLPKES